MNIINWLEALNRTAPEFPKEKKTDESRFDQSFNFMDTYHYYGITMAWNHEYDNWNDGAKRQYFDSRPDQIDSPTGNYSSSGVAQGTPTGPLLSAIILKNFLKQHPGLSYADDGLFYGNKKFKVQDDPESGIIIKPEKSGWIKWNGVWKKPLKFLGLVYDGKTLKAQTRKGSDLELTQDASYFIQAIDEAETYRKTRKGHSSKELSFESVFKSKYIGWIQSRLYQNTFNLEEFFQNFTYTKALHSWSEQVGEKPGRYKTKLDVFNSSSYASHWLIERCRYEDMPKRKVKLVRQDQPKNQSTVYQIH